MSKSKTQKLTLFLVFIAIIIIAIWLISNLSSQEQAEYNLPEEIKQAGEVQVKVNPNSSPSAEEEINVEDLRGMLNEF